MLLTISTTISPATDLGFLLHKNPAAPAVSGPVVRHRPRFSTRRSGKHRCTAALLLELTRSDWFEAPGAGG